MKSVINLSCAVAEVPETEAAVGRELDHRLHDDKTRCRNNQAALNYLKPAGSNVS